MQPRRKFLCFWADENGGLVVNEKQEYLCAESWTFRDKKVESAMLRAARGFGVTGGKAVWKEGRKVSHMEWEDQMERMMEGKIPDERQEHVAALEEEYIKDHGIPNQKAGS